MCGDGRGGAGGWFEKGKERNQVGAGCTKTQGEGWINRGRRRVGGEQSGVWNRGLVWGGGSGLKGRQVDCCTDVVAINASVAPEVQVSHASAACLALAGTHNNLSALLDALCKLLPFGLHPFLRQVMLTRGGSHQAQQLLMPMARPASTGL